MQEIILYNGEAEDLELRRLAYRVDERRNRAAREAAEARAQRAETKLRAERAKLRWERQKAKQELWGMTAFVSVMALIIVVLVGVLAAYHKQIGWPTGLLLAGGAVGGIILIMWKVGWLKNG